MESAIFFRGEFFFGSNNPDIAPQVIKPEFRFSLWKNEERFTAGELQELAGQDIMQPGDTAEVKIMMMNGAIAQSLKVGDILHWGAPSYPIGTVKVLEILPPKQKA